jgi:hypothetical protein
VFLIFEIASMKLQTRCKAAGFKAAEQLPPILIPLYFPGNQNVGSVGVVC